MASSPRRGDVYWVLFDPPRGVEQAGLRPALVVQNDLGNDFAPYTIVAALTTSRPKKPYPFMVAVPEGEGNLPRESYVNCAQILTVDKSRLDRRIGSLGPDTMERVDSALRYQLSLSHLSP